MTQQAQITFEVEETTVLRQGGKLITEFCPRCAKAVEMLSPDVLSLITGASEREIFRLVEGGMIHFAENDRLVVCPTCFKSLIG